MAAAIALVLFLPNLAWQYHHGWPSVSFASSQHAQTADDTPTSLYIAGAAVFLASCTALAIIGGVWMWRRPTLRPFAWAAALVTVGFAIEQGRPYYPLPALTLCVAAGAVALERWQPAERWRRRGSLVALVAVQLVVVAVAAPLVVPVRSTAGMIDSGLWKDSFYKDEIGWPELVAQTAEAWHTLPAAERSHAAILAENYGEAGALAHFGPPLGLPPPLSGHLSWQYWHEHGCRSASLSLSATTRAICEASARAFVRSPRSTITGTSTMRSGAASSPCHLRQPLGTLWHGRIARDQL